MHSLPLCKFLIWLICLTTGKDKMVVPSLKVIFKKSIITNGTLLFTFVSLNAHSLWENNIGDEGAKAIAGALEKNTALTSLK